MKKGLHWFSKQCTIKKETLTPQQRRKERMKNGQLWYNINTESVERVVGELNKIRVFTVGHGYSNMKAVKKAHLVKANQLQLDDYLEESNAIKKAEALAKIKANAPELPPLPKPEVIKLHAAKAWEVTHG